MLVSIATSVRHGFLSNTSPGRPLTAPRVVAADIAAQMPGHTLTRIVSNRRSQPVPPIGAPKVSG